MSGSNGTIRVNRERFAGRAKTQGYRPSVLGGAWWNAWLDGKPLFTLFDVERMRKDPMVDFCLRILRAPLANLKMQITADSPEVQQFIEAQWQKIWSTQLKKMLYCLEYGYAPGETEYAETNGYIQYQALHDVHPLDAAPVQWNVHPYKGLLAGVSVKSRGSFEDESKYSIYAPHAFWFAGETEFSRLYGRPRLAGMYEPWLEKRGRNGAVDSRRLWYRKNAFRGGTMRYPLGTTDYGDETTPDIRNNQDVAREIVEKQENGGVRALPNTPHPTIAGEYAWEYEDAESNPDVAGMRDYPKDLDDEIAVGAGIPVELIHATSSGLGDGGRDLPAIMFFASEDELAKLCITSIDQQQMGPMVRANFGQCKYEIKHESLVEIIKRDTSKAKEMTGQEPDQRKPQSQGVNVPGAESTAVQMSQALVDRVAALAATEYPDLPPIELASSDGRWAKKARKEGIPVESLNQFADEIMAHDKEFTGEYNRILKSAREYGEHEGGSLKGISNRAAMHGIDYTKIKGFDLVARRVATEYPGYFPDPEDAVDQLWDMLIAGNRETMTYEDALEKSFETLMEDKHAGGESRKDDDDEAIPFSLDAQGHEHKGKGEGGGQFTGKGKGGSKGKEAKAEKPAEKPKKGDRAAAVHALHQQLKKARLEAFEEIKADAHAAKAKADEHWAEIGEHVGNIAAIHGTEEPEQPDEPDEPGDEPKIENFRSEPGVDEYVAEKHAEWEEEKQAHDRWKKENAEWETAHENYEANVELTEAYNELEELKRNEPSTPVEQFEYFKDVEAAAKTLLEKNKAVRPGTGDNEITAEEHAENAKRAKAIIAACKAGRDAMRTYAEHRKEMKAIKEGVEMELGLEAEEFDLAFDESQVSRDSGKFASKPGAGAAAEGEQKKGGKFRALLALRHLVPGPVRRKVGGFVAKTYAKLEAKYGRPGAIACLTGMVLLSPTPIPGSSLIPIALAEGVKRLRRQFAGQPAAVAMSQSEQIDAETLAANIQAELAALYAEMGEEQPPIDEGEMMDVVDELLAKQQPTQLAIPETPKQQELSVSFQRDADNKLTGLSVVKREVPIA